MRTPDKIARTNGMLLLSMLLPQKVNGRTGECVLLATTAPREVSGLRESRRVSPLNADWHEFCLKIKSGDGIQTSGLILGGVFRPRNDISAGSLTWTGC